MSAAELVEQLQHLNNAERLVVIEAATRLIRQELAEQVSPSEDPLLQVAGCLSGEPLSAERIERELYGGELPE